MSFSEPRPTAAEGSPLTSDGSQVGAGPEAFARVEVTADNPAIEIRVLDSALEVLASGVGQLQRMVPPGLYELQYRAGSSTKSELIALRRGDTLVRTAHVDFPAAAPISVASNASDLQRAALDECIRQVPTAPITGAAGELVVFLRQVEPTAHGVAPDAFVPLGIVDENDRIVSSLEGDEVRYDAAGREWAAACLKLPPGTYALRVEPAKASAEAAPGSTAPRRAFDQSVCIEAGWQTIVFVPNVARGPAPQIASIHMTRMGERWDPSSPAVVTLETMLACMRDGRGIVPERILDLVTSSQTTNPMLGVVSAHSALLAEPPDFVLFDKIVSHLVESWPAFPDIRALYPIGEERRRYHDRMERLGRGEAYQEPPPPESRTPQVTWPPMLLASYQGLITCDAKWPTLTLIEEKSLAERAATRLLIGGLWSAWEPFGDTTTDEALRSIDRADRPTLVEEALDFLETRALKLFQHRVTAREWKSALDDWNPDDSVAIRLKEFLTEVVERSRAETVQDFVSSLDAQSISRGTGLPAGVIRRTLDRLQGQLRKTNWS